MKKNRWSNCAIHLPFLEYLRSLCCIHFEDGALPDVEVRYAVIGERGSRHRDGLLGPDCIVGYRCQLFSGRPFPSRLLSAHRRVEQ